MNNIGRIVRFKDGEEENEIIYISNMRDKDSKEKFYTEKQAIKQLQKDLKDKNVVRIENFTTLNKIDEIINEFESKHYEVLDLEKLKNNGRYYHRVNSRYPKYFEYRKVRVCLQGGLELKDGDSLILLDIGYPKEIFNFVEIPKEKYIDPALLLFSVDKNDFIGCVYATLDDGDSLSDTLECIGLDLALRGFNNIYIYFPRE